MTLRRLTATAIAVLGMLACLPAVASAGTYNVRVCDDTGGTYVNSVFTVAAQIGPSHASAGCVPGRGLYTDIAPLGLSWFPEGGSLQMCAPAGTRIAGYRMDVRTHWQGTGYDRRVDGGACGGYALLQGGALPSTFDNHHSATFARTGLSTGGMRLIAYCNTSPCTGNFAKVEWDRIVLTIDDYTAPAIANGRGLWGQTGWVRGTWNVAYDSIDATGIRSMTAQVDSGGWEGSVSGACLPDGNVTRLNPCASTALTLSKSFDTTTVSDGRHDLSFRTQDGGNNTAASPNQVFNVDNAPPTASLERGTADYGRTVRWKVDDAHSGVDVGSLAAGYSTDGGASWTAMGGSWDATGGTYAATLPSTVPDGPVRVRLGGRDNANPGGNSFTGAATPVSVYTSAPAGPSGLLATPEGWSASNSFGTTWRNPAGQSSSIVRARWTLCDGDCISGQAEGEGIDRLSGLTVPRPGRWELTVRLEDVAGNVGAAATTWVQYDPSPPAAPEVRVPGRWLNRDDATTWDANLSVPAEPPSGVAGYSVTRDGADPDGHVDVEASPWRLSNLADGATTIKARAVSGSPVAGPVTEAVIRVDRELPVAIVRGVGRPDTPHPGPVTVTLTGRDAVSGMGSLAYRIDGGGWERVPDDEVQIPVEGTGAHVLAYYVVDAAGNASVEQERTVLIGGAAENVRPRRPGFQATAANEHTTFTAADRFGAPCPREATLTADRDATITEAAPNARRSDLGVGPAPSRRDALIGFPLPAAPDCVVESATLRLYAVRADGDQGVAVRRASLAWSEALVSWNTRPGTVGAAAGLTPPTVPGWMAWDVTTQVRGLYKHGDSGLYLSGDADVDFCAREAIGPDCSGATRRPELTLRFSE